MRGLEAEIPFFSQIKPCFQIGLILAGTNFSFANYAWDFYWCRYVIGSAMKISLR